MLKKVFSGLNYDGLDIPDKDEHVPLPYQPPREQLFGSAARDENPPSRVALMTSDLGETFERPAPRAESNADTPVPLNSRSV